MFCSSDAASFILSKAGNRWLLAQYISDQFGHCLKKKNAKDCCVLEKKKDQNQTVGVIYPDQVTAHRDALRQRSHQAL